MNTALLREAIRLKKVVEFVYDGGTRVVEPHCLGTSTAGNMALRGFQVSGHSLTEGIPDWRFFDLSKILRLTVLDKTFQSPRPGYRRGDRGMDYIEAEL